jgi:radical SAM superfamily enzyme YgiQ (UPF0313 family)
VLKYLYSCDDQFNDYFRSMAAWLYFGGENVFLQDADSLIIKTPDMIEILNFLREKFPGIKRITSYCRSHTAARKTVEEFEQLRSAGLSRIHIGMESGSDEVLALIRKGTTAADHIKAGQKIRQAGIELSEYVMPGLGGTKLTIPHALETAKVLNAINPDFIRLRTLHVVPGTGLDELMKKGEFHLLSDEDVLREIQLIIENLDVRGTVLASDHILNLLEELGGKLPEDKAKLLSVIQRYFALPELERHIYRLGRRSGMFRKLDDMSDTETYQKLKSVVDYFSTNKSGLEEYLLEKMNNYI